MVTTLRVSRRSKLDQDSAFILSAKHHVLPLDQVIEPYDVTLNEMSAAEVREWSRRVLEQLRVVADPGQDRFTILAGRRYRKHVVPKLSNVNVPMEGLRIGEQLQFLSDVAAEK